MGRTHISHSPDNNSTAAVRTSTAAPGCPAAATGTTETPAGTAERRQSAAVRRASGPSDTAVPASGASISGTARDTPGPASGSRPVPGRVSACGPAPSLLHCGRWARSLPAPCQMHHVLRWGARASKAALQPAGTGDRRVLPSEEEAVRWVRENTCKCTCALQMIMCVTFQNTNFAQYLLISSAKKVMEVIK
jgi:hypothetical protein